jgi:hypothetical protein
VQDANEDGNQGMAQNSHFPTLILIIHKAQSLERHGGLEEIQWLGAVQGLRAICQIRREFLLCVLLILVRRQYHLVSCTIYDHDVDPKTPASSRLS